MNINREFEKISEAFDRVKSDNIYLKQRIDELEKGKEEMLRMILKESVETKVSEEDKIFIGNKGSRKVHSENCPYGRKISLDNREMFDSVQDALRQKYKRCSCVAD